MKNSIRRRSRAVDLRLPASDGSMSKGGTLKTLLDRDAVDCLAHNLAVADPRFDVAGFTRTALSGLAPLGILQRGQHLAQAMRAHLPPRFEDAIDVILRSLTPPLERTSDFGLNVFFYLPHTCFVATFGLDPAENGGRDPFEVSMRAQHELTRRFTAEFSIRPFLIRSPDRTLRRLLEWTRDPNPHVRRLCSEGTRSRLPWAQRIPAFAKDASPVLPILEALKDDPELYVRRSVANHIGDIAKGQPELAFAICERWLKRASPERRWLIRHALRHPAKKGNSVAIRLRDAAAARGA